MRRVYLRNVLVVCAALAVGFGVTAVANACSANQQTCSSGWGVSEAFFGKGGSLCDPTSSNPNDYEHSPTYCAKTAIGETGVGNVTSPTYQAQAGFNTDRYPSLTLIVNNPNANLGYLSTGSPSTTTATFSVQTYLASSYIITTSGSAPTNNGAGLHTLTPITTGGGGSSSAGTEQFGMNLVANTSPTTFGANASCQTSGFCTLGTVPTNYGTTNKYYYNNGDTIATGSSNTGQTNYTISYIFNISNLTPDGTYTFNQSIVATSTF